LKIGDSGFKYIQLGHNVKFKTFIYNFIKVMHTDEHRRSTMSNENTSSFLTTKNQTKMPINQSTNYFNIWLQLHATLPRENK